MGEKEGVSVEAMQAVLEEHGKRLEKHEVLISEQGKGIAELQANHKATEVYVEQILNSITNLETKIFNFMTNVLKDQTKDRNAERNNQTKAATSWQEVIKYIIVATIGGLMAHIFTK